MDRLPITKTHKLFIGGRFPRTESGRSLVTSTPGGVAHVCRASRKDLRNAVEAARGALPSWSACSAYLRGQILYRLAEMIEGKRGELVQAIGSRSHIHGPDRAGSDRASPPQSADLEVLASIDRVVYYAGWCDKYAHVAGCANPVSGPYHNFTIPEPVGVVGVIAPDERPLLALVSLIAPAICMGSTVVTLASEASPIAACVLAEGVATSDLPAGVVNILTGVREELTPHFASHRDIDAIHAANIEPALAQALREGVAENLKRVTVRDRVEFFDGSCESPEWIEAFVNFKTLWHPGAT